VYIEGQGRSEILSVAADSWAVGSSFAVIVGSGGGEQTLLRYSAVTIVANPMNGAISGSFDQQGIEGGSWDISSGWTAVAPSLVLTFPVYLPIGRLTVTPNSTGGYRVFAYGLPIS
jgi:hypothetical protein